jgi:hypothetical protein
VHEADLFLLVVVVVSFEFYIYIDGQKRTTEVLRIVGLRAEIRKRQFLNKRLKLFRLG